MQPGRVPRQTSAPAALDSMAEEEVPARSGTRRMLAVSEEQHRRVGSEDGAAGGTPTASRSCLLVYSAGAALERSRPLLRRLEDAGVQVLLHTDQDLAKEAAEDVPRCDALLVLWSQFFTGGSYERKLKEISARAVDAGAIVLNNVEVLVEMQDRRWLLRKLKEHGVPTPEFVECSRDGGQRPSLEERDDCIIVEGQRISKPFVEKPVDRRDREIYVYFPKASGGGRALVSTTESGDIEYICSFDTAGNVRREGSFIYQEYLQSEGFVVQTVCAGGLVYGNAVLSGIVGRSQSESPAANVRTGGRACAVWLRQEEKLIASKLKEVFHQTLFGITFTRSQTADRPATSFVVDIWPGLPRTGLSSHCGDATRALLSEFAAVERGMAMRRSCSFAWDSPKVGPTASSPRFASRGLSCRASSKSISGFLGHSMPSLDLDSDQLDSDLLCVLLVARHGDRTPKQKVKVKIKLACEFAAGWLCGWLADTTSGPPLATTPATFELRKPEQLRRLMTALKQLQEQGYHVGTLIDALGCITRDGMACHAKIGADGATVAVTLKWGGELTAVGVDEAESLGWCFRCKTFPGEDIDELHATLRHDVKIYASKEPRCQQTAAAFSKGMLRLDSPLPPIIAALVRTDDFKRQEENSKSYVDKEQTLLPADASWEELEALAGPCVSEELRAYGMPGPALRVLRERLERLQLGLQEGACGGQLHQGETHALLVERYRDALAELGPKDAPLLHKVPYVLDHLQYDGRHNREALPPAALLALDEAAPLAEALCDVVVPLEAAVEQRDGGGSCQAGRSILAKLRWDLRLASGADLGEETTHLDKHEALYSLAPERWWLAAAGAVRTRLYFGHNSWIRGLCSLFSCGNSACDCQVGKACSELSASRLGFLSHFAVRLWRKRPSGELQVSCDFAHSGSEEPKQLFELPLATVDAWWSEVLQKTASEDAVGAKEEPNSSHEQSS
mmetsp:Transcript_106240/g.310585  ORF Transcript_106240/g.310585 Transcript_106240/m.310585 type:complete len:963 (-) Transcript_106240:145-3033(-)